MHRKSNLLMMSVLFFFVGNIGAQLKIYNKTSTDKKITTGIIFIPAGSKWKDRKWLIIQVGNFLSLAHKDAKHKFSKIHVRDGKKNVEYLLEDYSPEEQDATELWITPVDSKNPAGDFMIVDRIKQELKLKQEIRALSRQQCEPASFDVEGEGRKEKETIIPGESGIRGLITEYLIGEEEKPEVSATAGSGSEGDKKETMESDEDVQMEEV